MAKMVDRSGRVVDVPDDQVQAAYLSGQYAFPKGAKINVTGPDGAVYSVDETDAEEAFRSGYRPATPDEIQYDLDRQRYDTVAGAIAAAGEGAARGATVGLSDPLAIGTARFLGGDEAAESVRQHLEGVRRFNPTAATLGEIGGAAAPLLASGGATGAVQGAGLAARGARAAGTVARTVGAPVRGVEALGALAERGVARAIGTEAASAGARVAQAGARWAARGAVEGAAWEAGMAVSEAALGDTELTGEKLLAAMGEGALVGGTFGGAMGVAGRTGLEGARATAKSIEALAERTWGKAAPGLGEWWVRLQSSLTGADPEAIRKLGIQNMTPEAREARRLVTVGAEEAHDTAVRSIRRDMDALGRNARAIADEARGGLKIDHVRKIVARGNEDTTHTAARRFLDELKESIENMRSEKGAYGQQANLNQAKSAIEYYEKRIANRLLDGQADNAELFADLDHLKQRIGKWAAPGRYVVSADQATHAVMREHYKQLQQLLENTRLWGRAADAQKEINRGWVHYLDTLERFERAFATVGDKDEAVDFWARKMIADPAKIDAYVKQIGLVRQDLTREVLQAHIDNTLQFTRAISKYYDVPKEKLAAFADMQRAAESLRKTLKEAEDTVGLVNQLKALEAADARGAGAGLLGLAGGAFAGPVGMAAGAVGGALMQPGRSVRQMAVLESMAGRLTERVEGGIKGFISKAKVRAARGATATGRTVYRAGIFAASQDAREKRRRYERMARAVRMAASNPEAVSRAVYASLGPSVEVAPKAAAATAAAAQRAVTFLASKLPPQGAPRNFLQPELDEPSVSDAEMARFMRYAEAVESPTKVLDDLEKGTLSREAVEALRVVYPRLYEQIRVEIMARVGELQEQLAYSDRIQLGILFDVPTDASLRPDFMALMQSSFVSPDTPPAAPPRGASVDIARDVATEAERVATS